MGETAATSRSDAGTDELDLSGTWRGAVSDEELERRYTAIDFDDDEWSEIAVPGHWQRHGDFATEQGPILLRRSFEHSGLHPAERAWLCFGGVFYQSDVWFDASLLGDTEGYFVPHQFEITNSVKDAARHTVAVSVACAAPGNRARKRNVTGIFQHSDCFDPSWNPGGIWRPVTVVRSGPIRIRHSRVLCTDANRDLATVAIRLVLDSDADRDVTIRTRVAGVEQRRDQRLAAGENQVAWTLGIEDPDLWWPRSLGAQPLHDVEIDVFDEFGAVSDHLRRRIGLRSVQTRDWITHINGERIFVKGANQGPTNYWMAEATAEDHRRVVELAIDTGLDMIRLQAHVGDPAIYDAADEVGLMIWQDFPLQWGYHPSVRRPATRQAREMVDLLGHHPSITLWCAHHEPMAIDPTPARLADPSSRRRLLARAAVAQQLPAYNRTVIDRSVSRILRRCDGSRPVVSHAGGLPRLPELSGTDTHLFLGWFLGDERQLPGLAATVPRLARFLGAFGAQAPTDSFAAEHSDGWPNLDWDRLGRTTGVNHAAFERHVPPRAFPSAAAWVDAAQRYQADVVRFQVETLRRLKYRPAGGFAVSGLADGAPGVTLNVVDHEGRPKLAHQALRDACRPVLAIADRLPPHVHADEQLLVDVHVVNDTRHELADASVVAEARWPGGAWHREWEGTVAPDSCVWIGVVDPVLSSEPLPFGDEAPTELVLTLTVRHAGQTIESTQVSPFVTDHGARGAHHG